MKRIFIKTNNLQIEGLKFNEYASLPANEAGDIFLILSDFKDEMTVDLMQYADDICAEILASTKEIKEIAKYYIQENRKAKFFYVGINSGVRNALNVPISPIKDEAIFSLFKTLDKELSSFGLNFYGIAVESIDEILDLKIKRDYRKDMKVFSTRKSPIKLHALIELIKAIAVHDNSMLSGGLLSCGSGVSINY